MKFKKLMALMMSGAMAVTMMSGCGEQQTGSVDVEDDETKPYELVMYYLTTGTTDDLKMVQDKMNEYLKKKINATIKLYPYGWGEIFTKTDNAISVGEQVDIAFANRSVYTSNVYAGKYNALDELVDKYAPKTKKALGEDFMEGAKVDGKLYALQNNKDKAHVYTYQYRKDLADKYGIDMSGIKTFDDVYAVLEEVKNKIPDVYAFDMGLGTTPTVLQNFFEVDSFLVMVDKDGKRDKVYNMYETPDYLEGIQQSRTLFENGYIPKDIVTNDNKNELIAAGKVFSIVKQSMPGAIDLTNIEEKKKGREWAEIALTDTLITSVNSQGSMMTIPVTSKNPARAMKFLELLNTDEYLNNLLVYGVEGYHFDKVGDKTIHLSETNTGYNNVNNQWAIASIFTNYLMDTEDPERFDKLQKFNDEGKISPYLGFAPNLEKFKVERTVCQNLISDYQKTLEFGAADPEATLKEMNAKLKSAGIDDIVAEAQRQYDAWKKSK